MYNMKDVNPNAVRLHLFPFSLLGKAKQWFYTNRAIVNTWDKCSTAFLSKFFLMGKTNAFVQESQASSRQGMSRFLKDGNECRSMWPLVRIIGGMTGSSC
jgi:hypothetical protein